MDGKTDEILPLKISLKNIMRIGTTPHAGKAEWTRGKLEPVPACPACGSQKRHKGPMSCRDHRIDLADTWMMRTCAGCGSLYLDPRPDASSLPHAYKLYYTHTSENETPPSAGMGGLLWRLIHGYLNHRFGMDRAPASKFGVPLFSVLMPLRLKLDYYGRHLFSANFPLRGRLLDVGCGNGTFLARASEMGWKATGLEPDPQAVATCCENGLDVVKGSLETAPASWRGQFDVLTMSHVIEHVPHPQTDLELALTMLKPGGLIWIALPNPAGLGAIFFGHSWRELHPPYHLCIATQEEVIRMLTEAGFVSISAHRIGARNKRALRESAENARYSGSLRGHLVAACTSVVSLVADLSATFSSRMGEETVLTARRPFQP